MLLHIYLHIHIYVHIRLDFNTPFLIVKLVKTGLANERPCRSTSRCITECTPSSLPIYLWEQRSCWVFVGRSYSFFLLKISRACLNLCPLHSNGLQAQPFRLFASAVSVLPQLMLVASTYFLPHGNNGCTHFEPLHWWFVSRTLWNVWFPGRDLRKVKPPRLSSPFASNHLNHTILYSFIFYIYII